MTHPHRKRGYHRPKRIKCEVWSRVVGYLRPIEKWSDAKQLEFKDRQVYKVGERWQ